MPPEDVPIVVRGNPRYRFLFGKWELTLTKRKPEPTEVVTDSGDQDSGCDGFNIGMMLRDD